MGFSRQEYWSGVPLPSPPADPLMAISPAAEYISLGPQKVGHAPLTAMSDTPGEVPAFHL